MFFALNQIGVDLFGKLKFDPARIRCTRLRRNDRNLQDTVENRTSTNETKFDVHTKTQIESRNVFLRTAERLERPT